MPTEFFQLAIRPLFVASPILLVLASCGTSHVGEAWQCPLAQGMRCVDVEAADPAVRPVSVAIGLPPLALDTSATVGPEATRTEVAIHEANPAAASKRSSRNPLAALWRWLTRDGSPDSAIGETENSGRSGDAVDFASNATVEAEAEPESGSSEEDLPAAASVGAAGIVAERSGSTAAEQEVASQGIQPAVAGGAGSGRLAESSATAGANTQFVPPANVRIPEKIGRVWIAPWVDAHGVYREGAWVRVVISPAAWRLP